MALLKRKRVLTAKIETTIGTAETLTASEGAFNAYNVMIQPEIEFDEREGQGGFAYLASIPGGYKGKATFQTDLAWDGTATEPAWADLFFPACGLVKSTNTYYPKTEAPASSVKTLTIGCYMDGMFKSIKGAMGTFKLVFPTGKRAYIDWEFSGVWVTPPTDVPIVDPTYPTEKPLRAAGGATTYNSVSLCYSQLTFDVGNTVMMRECPTDASGFHSAIVTNRQPKITVDPEAKLVATRPSYTNWIAQLEATFTATIASVTGNGTFAITAPKAQIINIQEGDRDRLVTDEIEFQCNRNGNTEDQEFSFVFTPDS